MDHACILKCSGSVFFWAVYGHACILKCSGSVSFWAVYGHACILKCSGSVFFWAVYGPCMHTKVQWECVLLGSVWTCMHTKVQWECVLLGSVWTMHAYQSAVGVCPSGQCMDHACILKCSGSVFFWAVYGPCMHTKVQWECVLLGSVWTMHAYQSAVGVCPSGLCMDHACISK